MKRIIITIFILLLAALVSASGIDSDTVLMLHADGDDSFGVGDGYAVFDAWFFDIDSTKASV